MNSQEKYDQALRYLKGDGIPRDIKEAVRLLIDVEKEGIVGAKYYLAELHLFNQISEADPKEAIRLFEEYLEIRPDDSDAMCYLCKLYCDWKKPEQWNPERGLIWLERFEHAIKKKGGRAGLEFGACDWLGDIYATGGMKRDRVKRIDNVSFQEIETAIEYLELAVTKGETIGVPNEYLDHLRNYLAVQKKRLEAGKNYEQSLEQLLCY